jgi:hypothetical protein
MAFNLLFIVGPIMGDEFWLCSPLDKTLWIYAMYDSSSLATSEIDMIFQVTFASKVLPAFMTDGTVGTGKGCYC